MKLISIRLSDKYFEMIDEIKKLYALNWPDGTQTETSTSNIIRIAIRTLYFNDVWKKTKKS